MLELGHGRVRTRLAGPHAAVRLRPVGRRVPRPEAARPQVRMGFPSWQGRCRAVLSRTAVRGLPRARAGARRRPSRRGSVFRYCKGKSRRLATSPAVGAGGSPSALAATVRGRAFLVRCPLLQRLWLQVPATVQAILAWSFRCRHRQWVTQDCHYRRQQRQPANLQL